MAVEVHPPALAVDCERSAHQVTVASTSAREILFPGGAALPIALSDAHGLQAVGDLGVGELGIPEGVDDGQAVIVAAEVLPSIVTVALVAPAALVQCCWCRLGLLVRNTTAIIID